MAFSKTTWQNHLPIYQAIIDMPFNQELSEGSLSQDAFLHYIIQDAHYLDGFASALASAAVRGEHSDHIVEFSAAANGTITEERQLHQSYFKQYQITAEEFAQTELSPICELYVSYLAKLAWAAPYAVLLAGLLPCFWIYMEVGNHIHKHAKTPNPYQEWIDAYASDEFETQVRRVIELIDRVGEQNPPHIQAQMDHAFKRSAQLEWMFWDSAYHQKQWPI